MLFEPYFSCCLFIALHQICYLHYRNTAYFIFPFFHELEKTQSKLLCEKSIIQRSHDICGGVLYFVQK